MKWVEVGKCYGNSIWVNLNHISLIVSLSDGKRYLWFASSQETAETRSVDISEDEYKKIMKLIQDT